MPRVVGAPVTFECRVTQIQPYPPQQPNCHLIFAEVLLAHIDEAVLNEQGRIDPLKLDLVGREEFDIQTQVLQRTREKLKALEARLDRLESPPEPPDQPV